MAQTRCSNGGGRAIGDTTLTLSATANYNFAEAWATLRATANRLIGLWLRYNGRFHRITAQTAGAALTFTPALAEAMTAEVSEFEIQADLPPIIASLMFTATTSPIRFVYGKTNTIATDWNTLGLGMSKLLFDSDHSVGGVPARNLIMTSDDAAILTTEVECYAA
jgi:hypothetical protein